MFKRRANYIVKDRYIYVGLPIYKMYYHQSDKKDNIHLVTIFLLVEPTCKTGTRRGGLGLSAAAPLLRLDITIAIICWQCKDSKQRMNSICGSNWD